MKYRIIIANNNKYRYEVQYHWGWEGSKVAVYKSIEECEKAAIQWIKGIKKTYPKEEIVFEGEV